VIHEENFKRKAKPPAGPPMCPYCGSPSRLAEGRVIGRRDPIWLCGAYPACDSYVGCHPGSTRPLGSLANPQLREMRVTVHRRIDSLWRKSGDQIKRGQIYDLVAAVMRRRSFHAGVAREEDIQAFEAAWPRIEATARQWRAQEIRLPATEPPIQQESSP